jgi:hypothetical protein
MTVSTAEIINLRAYPRFVGRATTHDAAPGSEAEAPDGGSGRFYEIPKCDAAAALDFQKRWAPQGLWVLSAKTAKGFPTRTFHPGEEQELAAWIDEHHQRQENMYWLVNSPRRDLSKKASATDIAAALGCHVDLDPLKGHPLDEERMRILAAMQAHEPPFTVILDSGRGYQGFYLLEAPSSDLGAAVTVNRWLERKLGGDHCHDICRVMRLPFTVNYGDADKLAQGYVPALAHVVQADWNLRYDIEDLLAAAEKDGGKKEEEEVAVPDHPALRKLRLEISAKCRLLIITGKHKSGDRSDGVYAVVCELVRCGYRDELIETILLDPTLGISEHVRVQADGTIRPDPEKYAHRQIPQAVAKMELRRDLKGKLIADSQDNIRLAMRKLGVRVAYDSFADRMLIAGLDGSEPVHLGDAELDRLYLLLDKQFGFRPGGRFYLVVVQNTAHRNSFHPVLDYLNGLQWDGRSRIDTWLRDYAGAEDTPYIRAVGRLLLIAAVRRVRQPGCKFDEMPVWESAQGLNKSQALRLLAVKDEWFSDDLPLDVDGKEVIERTCGIWIGELAELNGIKKGEIEHVKSFQSRQVDRARLAYGRVVTERPRQFVVVGTTNTERYLKDPTGNRRFWPVKIEIFDLDTLRRDRDQLWAEAAMAEAKGESIRLDKALYSAAAAEQAERVQDDPWYLVLADILDNDIEGKIASEQVWALVGLEDIGRRTQDHNERLGNVMRALRFKRKKLRIRLADDKRPVKRWCYVRGDERKQLFLVPVGNVMGNNWRLGEPPPWLNKQE